MSDIKLPPLPKPDRLMENDDYLICGYTQDQMENYARAAMAATPAPHDVPAAMRAVIAAMKADPEYAWSWHCNVAMAFVDAGGDHYTANQGAARFMRALAGVEPAHELPALAATPAPAEPLWSDLTLDEVKARLQCLNVDDLRGLVVSLLITLRIERKAKATTPAPSPPATLSPIARRRVFDAIRGAYELGFSDHKAGSFAVKEVETDHGGALIHALERAMAATPAPAEPVAWTLRETLDKRQTTCSARLWFTNPGNFGWVPLYAEPWAAMLAAAPEVTAAPADSGLEALRKMLQEAVDQLKVPTPAPHPDTADAERYRKLVASGKYTAASIGGGWGLSCGGARWTKAELDAAADALPSVRAQAQKGE